VIDLDALKARLREYDDALPRCPQKVARTVNYAPDYLTPQHTPCADAVYREYDMTTYSPCCRPEGHEGECRNSRLILGWPGFVTVTALVAEVEILRQEARIRNNINDGLAAEVGKLRAENAELELGVETMRTRMNNAYAQRNRIQNEERAAVVAWLRTVAPNAPTRRGADELAWCADRIERGEHRRKE
jgi:hypothetical protein